MHDDYAIEVAALQKRFGDVEALRGVDIGVRAGEIFSLLGPNGAGKSTTISILACLLAPSGGDACVMGHSVLRESMAVKRLIGVVPQDVALYTDLSARENLMFWGRMYGLRGAALRRRAEAVLNIIGLAERQHGRVDTFSGGMKRRINIGVALMHEPKVIIMDEPTVGIDPQSRRHILDEVKELNRQGMTVLYTTHYMEEAQELSDHIAIMDQGRVIARGTHSELVRLVGEYDRIDLSLNASAGALPARLLEAWRAMPGVRSTSAAEGRVTLLATAGNRTLPGLFESAAQYGVRIISIQVTEPNLEAVFLHLTGKALRD